MEFNFSSRLDGLGGNAIREIFKVLQDPEMISFAGGMPANDLLPVDDVKRFSEEVLASDGKKILQYGSTEGYLPLRKTYIEFVKRFGIKDIDLDNTLIISGGQQGIDLMCKAMINKGDVVLVQEPTYLASLHIFKTYEAKAVGVKSSADGLDIEDLEEKIKTYKPKFVYLVPTFCNPTGKTLTLETRKKALEVCSKYDLPIVEDDPYRELRYSGEPLPAIKSLDDKGLVLYLTSASKVISPGLRVGVAIGDQLLIRKMTVLKQAVDVHTSALSQAVVEKFISSGVLDKNLQKSIPIYRHKRDLFLSCLDKYMPSSFTHTVPDGGLFVWGEFTDGTSAKAKFTAALEKKVAYVCGNDFFADGRGDNTIRLNFSNATDEQIELGVKRLGEIFKEK